MFIQTDNLDTYKQLKEIGAKEIKQSNRNYYIFLYDKEIIDKYNEKYTEVNLFLTDKIDF